MNLVGSTVAIDAQNLFAMNTATQTTKQFAVTFGAAVLVSQRLEVVALVLCRDVSMTFRTNEVRMGAGIVCDVLVFVSFSAVNLLCRCERRKQ